MIPRSSLVFTDEQKEAYYDDNFDEVAGPCIGDCLTACVGYSEHDKYVDAQGREVVPGEGKVNLATAGEILESAVGVPRAMEHLQCS